MIPLLDVSSERLCDAWNASDVSLLRYRLDPDIVAINLLASPLLHETASVWSEGSFVAVKRNAAGLYPGPDPGIAHISLLGGSTGLGSLLRHSMDVLRKEGVQTLVFGMDSGHFFPGVPTDVPWLERLLEECGFVSGGLSHDLQRDLSHYAVSPELVEADFRTLSGNEFETLTTFLQREFPGRWHYDVVRKVEAEGPQTVFGLFVDGVCEGFALLQHDGCRLPIGGAVWRSDLGPEWGSLGPIGISKAMRGQGLGNALLGRALEFLQSQGARNTIIDWTGLVGFYGAHGFSVTRSYRSFRVDLAEAPQS